jgi:hypothetical protein
MHESWASRFSTVREAIFWPEVGMQLALCQIDAINDEDTG